MTFLVIQLTSICSIPTNSYRQSLPTLKRVRIENLWATFLDLLDSEFSVPVLREEGSIKRTKEPDEIVAKECVIAKKLKK